MDHEQEYLHRLRHHLMGGGAHHHHPGGGGRGGEMKKISDYPTWGEGEDLYEDLFFYSATFGSLAPSQSLPKTILIQTDSKFEWMKTTYYAILHGETPPTQNTDQHNITFFLTDSGTGRQLMNEPIFIGAVVGDGKRPAILSVTRIFQPNATITITASNVDATATYDNVEIVLSGRKIFKGPPGASG
jgi:hypothetical protein